MTSFAFAEPPPYQHQLDALKFLIDKDGTAALFFEVGTGKSRCVIDYLGVLTYSTSLPVRVLVCAPRSVQDTWQLQVDEWGSPSVFFHVQVLEGSILEKIRQLTESKQFVGPMVEIKVINYEALSSRRTSGAKLHSDLILDAVKKWAPHVLVCDESHRLKSNSGNASRLVQRIAKVVKRRILLTGTPMPHSPLDVYSQFRILDDTVFAGRGVKPMNYSQFMNKICKLGGYMGKQIMGWENLDWLEDRMATRSASLSKGDCLDLPPVTVVDVPVRLDPREAAAYQKVKQDMLVLLEAGQLMSAQSMLVLRLRLRQLTCGFAQPDDGGEIQWLGQSRIETCLELLQDTLGSEKRVVVFGWARPEIDKLVSRLDPSEVRVITGDTKEKDRLRIRQEFGDVLSFPERQILVCQWRTISLGINELVTASHGILLSLSQQRDDILQGMGRLDRPGQTRPVTFHNLQVPQSVDAVIWKAHMERADLEDRLLDYLKGTP